MKDRKLYIIGNGFDLWHGIPSSFGQFRSFVGEHQPELLKAVQDYLPVDENWSDLELALAEIDVANLIEDLEHFMPGYGTEDWSDSGHHDFQYEVARVVESLSRELRHRFGQWISQLPIPQSTTAGRRLQTIDPTAFFLNFNYTTTLQELYDVPDAQILHIHGRANLPDSDLVLGHAWNPIERRSLNSRSDIEEIDTRLMEAHSILDRYFSDTFKPSADLILKHLPFFQRLTEIQEVRVLGHSLSAVDELYFRSLLTIPGMTSAQWLIACHLDSDFQTMPAILVALGVYPNRIVTCSWPHV